MKIKGGSITRSRNFEITKLISRVTDVKDLGADSVGGFLFRITISPDNDLMCIFPGNKEDNMIKPVTSLLLKVCQIGDWPNEDRKEKRFGKEVIAKSLFMKEINIQREIHNKSFDLWCEPICPKIIYFIDSYNSADRRMKSFIDRVKYKNEYGQNTPIVQNIHTSSTVNDLGFFFMEDIGGNTGGVVQDLFPNYKHHPHITNPLNTNQKAVLDNYIYQIIRLAELGYKHGDTHLGNALYYSNYDYIDNYKVILIDFGRTTKFMFLRSFDPDTITMSGDYWSYKQLNYHIKNSIGRTSEVVKRWFDTTKREKIYTSRNNFYQKLLTRGNAIRLQELVINDKHDLYDVFQEVNIFDKMRIRALNLVDINALKENDYTTYEGFENCGTITISPIFKEKHSLENLNIKEIYNFYSEHGLCYKSSDFSRILNIKFNGRNVDFIVFLWCIGIPHGSVKPELFFIPVLDNYRIAGSYYFLYIHSNLKSLYCSGQFLKYKRNDSYYLWFSLYDENQYLRQHYEEQNPNGKRVLEQNILFTIRRFIKPFIINNPDYKVYFKNDNLYANFICPQLFCPTNSDYDQYYTNNQLDKDQIIHYMQARNDFMSHFPVVYNTQVNNRRIAGGRQRMINYLSESPIELNRHVGKNIISKKLNKKSLNKIAVNSKNMDIFNLPVPDDKFIKKHNEYLKQNSKINIKDEFITRDLTADYEQLEKIKKSENTKVIDIINLLDSYAIENTSDMDFVELLNKSNIKSNGNKNIQNAGKRKKKRKKSKKYRKSRKSKKNKK